MLSPVTSAQFEKLSERFPEATLTELPSGSALVSLPSVKLPSGWSLTETPIWFVVPVGYPGPCPDCFWASRELRLANGQMPQATQDTQPVPEVNYPALWFSWHVVDQGRQWNPSRDTLSTYMSIILLRLQTVE